MTYTLQGESMGLHMPISVGNNPIYVGIDTGSVGLRVLQSQLSDMSNINVTTTPESYGYADGVHLSGYLANGPINIGGVIESINFMLVESVTCIDTKPDCPRVGFESYGKGGLMGVRLDVADSKDGIWSPLGQLPGNLSNGFIVTGYIGAPSMTIGLTSNNTNNFSYVKLISTAQPSINPAPYSLWNVMINSGVSFPELKPVSTLSVTTESGPVIYDTGTSDFTIYNIPESWNSINYGSSISMYQPLSNGNTLTTSFTTGSTGFVNAAAATSSSGGNIIINTGNIPFTKLDVLYNIESGLIGFRQHNPVTATPQTSQMIYSDDFSCLGLNVCSNGQAADLSCVSQTAYNRCIAAQNLSQSGVTLNDSNNLYILMFQHQVAPAGAWPMWMSTSSPTTLFAGFTMVYSPDPSAAPNEIGWPIADTALQQNAYNAGSADTCLAYTGNSVTSKSPWLSHCSTFTAWAESQVFAVQVPPAEPRIVAGSGNPNPQYDWCGLADANHAALTNGEDGWTSVATANLGVESPVAAQLLANQGCAVVANYYNSSGAGHIAVVLPNTWQQAQVMQQGSNYPLNVLVNSSSTFQSLIEQVGTEEMQSGLYNFQHTVVYNGFYSELKVPSDYATIVYFYNPASCPGG
jgi:hypothetical protein